MVTDTRREVLQQALDALEHVQWKNWRTDKAIAAIRAELAKPEPVAVAFFCHGHLYEWPSEDDYCGNVEDHILLYALPPTPPTPCPTP